MRFCNSITKRKDGRYMGKFIIGYDDSGKALYQYVYGRTYEEAEEKLIIGREIESRFLSERCVTVNRAYSEWLGSVANRVKPSTYANYKLKFEKHILPAFGDKLCSELTSNVFNSFIDKKLADGLSASYVKDIIIVLKTMLKFAQDEFNFKLSLKNISLPRTEKKSAKTISADGQSTLVKYLESNMSLTSFGVLISLLMGIRIGELCGLKWSDVDLKNKTLYIERTVQRIAIANGDHKTSVIISSPKSSASRRVISIPDRLIKYFERFKDHTNYFVLSGSEKAVEPRTMQYRYKRLLAAAKVKYHNYHQLRHTFATNCVQSGFDAKTLSNVLGHSSVTLTLMRYVHPDIAYERRMMNDMCMLV